MVSPKLPRLTYFSSRGRAELIRLLCADAGIEHEETSLGVYDPVHKTPDFLALRATGKLPLGAVPIWEEADGLLIAQSDVIVRHLARTRGYEGRDRGEVVRCDMVLSGLEDMRLEVRKLVTVEPARRAALREEMATATLPRWLADFEKLLDGNHGGRAFIVGGEVTVADVALYGTFEGLHDNGLGVAYSKCPKLAAHASRMAERPGIARYCASPSRFPVQRLPS